jgi:hypothetical protein
LAPLPGVAFGAAVAVADLGAGAGLGVGFGLVVGGAKGGTCFEGSATGRADATDGLALADGAGRADNGVAAARADTTGVAAPEAGERPSTLSLWREEP